MVNSEQSVASDSFQPPVDIPEFFRQFQSDASIFCSDFRSAIIMILSQTPEQRADSIITRLPRSITTLNGPLSLLEHHRLVCSEGKRSAKMYSLTNEGTAMHSRALQLQQKFIDHHLGIDENMGLYERITKVYERYTRKGVIEILSNLYFDAHIMPDILQQLKISQSRFSQILKLLVAQASIVRRKDRERPYHLTDTENMRLQVIKEVYNRS